MTHRTITISEAAQRAIAEITISEANNLGEQFTGGDFDVCREQLAQMAALSERAEQTAAGALSEQVAEQLFPRALKHREDIADTVRASRSHRAAIVAGDPRYVEAGSDGSWQLREEDEWAQRMAGELRDTDALLDILRAAGSVAA